MNLKVEITGEPTGDWCPDTKSCVLWLGGALRTARREPAGSISLGFVSEEEIAALNSRYRGTPGVTNVLSFPAGLPDCVTKQVGEVALGDIVICPPVVAREAHDQGKSLQAHWAHLLVHGCLHLLGYDHQTDDQAAAMESLEIKAMAGLGFENPYLIG